VYDHDSSGSHDLIGTCQASLAALQQAAQQGQGLPLLHPKKAGKPGYVSSGGRVGEWAGRWILPGLAPLLPSGQACSGITGAYCRPPCHTHATSGPGTPAIHPPCLQAR